MVNLENLASYLLLQYSIYAVSDTAAYRNKQIDEHLESTFSENYQGLVIKNSLIEQRNCYWRAIARTKLYI